MKAALLVLMLAFAGVASCNRHLLQNATTPAPAPGPASCPPKRAPASTCTTNAATFQAGCADYIKALNGATGGKVTAETDEEIKTLVGQLSAAGSTPTAACCTAATTLLGNACACSTTVQALAKSQQNLSPSQFQTVGKVFLTACQKPTCTDTCQLA